jgi:hypothetical protein
MAPPRRSGLFRRALQASARQVNKRAVMARYLIESPHSAADCVLIVNQVHAMGYLHNFDWGCDAGVHCGWAILEADSEAEAAMAVPTLVRGEARVIPIVKYTPDQVRQTHDL